MFQQSEITLTKINPRKRSNTWNNSSSKLFFECLPTNRQVKTTCLFCPNPVLIEKVATDTNADIIRRNLILKNLCLHLNISSNIIPDDCSRSMFPFCRVCEELLNQLWEFQEVLDKVWLKISNVVSAIEKAVAEGELCSSTTSTVGNLNKQRFTQLRNTILEGYRQKLEIKDDLIHNNSGLGMETTKIELPAANLTNQTCSPVSGERLVKASNELNLDKQEGELSQVLLPATICDLIKRKISRTSHETALKAKAKGEKERDCDIFEIKPRKRRLLFEEVEVFKCISLKPKVEYLQCSLCNYTISIPKYTPKGHSTTYNKMKAHILLAHKSKPTAGQTETNHDCSQEFPVECDVCLRPIKKGNTLFNLQLHKFSHKNAEERKAAFAAGEVKGGRPKKKETIEQMGDGQHQSIRDNQVKPVHCPVCKRTFSKLVSLVTHFARFHNDNTGWTSASTLEFEPKRAKVEPVAAVPQSMQPIVTDSAAKTNMGCIEEASLREIIARCFGSSYADKDKDTMIP